MEVVRDRSTLAAARLDRTAVALYLYLGSRQDKRRTCSTY
jgi:hypothetical protein